MNDCDDARQIEELPSSCMHCRLYMDGQRGYSSKKDKKRKEKKKKPRANKKEQKTEFHKIQCAMVSGAFKF